MSLTGKSTASVEILTSYAFIWLFHSRPPTHQEVQGDEEYQSSDGGNSDFEDVTDSEAIRDREHGPPARDNNPPAPPYSPRVSVSRSPTPARSPAVKEKQKGRPKASKNKAKTNGTRRDPSQEELLVQAVEKERQVAAKQKKDAAAAKRREKAAAKRKETGAGKRKAAVDPTISQRRPRKRNKVAEETQHDSEFENWLAAGDEIYTPEELVLVQGARARHQKQVAETAHRDTQLGGGGGGDLQHPREVVELSDDDFVDISRQNQLIYGSWINLNMHPRL
ncbi:hypothetical protein XANCAGTX0491_009130 [Xanthoria calcicola]